MVLMGLEKTPAKDLQFMLQKRTIDLQVLGFNVEENPKTVDAGTGKMETLPQIRAAIDSKIKDLVDVARELALRKCQ